MKYYFCTFLFSILTSFIIAQDGTIRGFVYDKETGEPVIFTNVVLEGTTQGAATDVNGYYSITKVAKGNHTILVTFLGYDTLRLPVIIERPGQIITEKLILQKSSIDLQVFNVSAEKQDAQNQVKMSVTKITPKEIKQIPSIGGDPDLAQYLQVLPGVIFTGDQGGQLYIRGGSPIQNKVLLDGMIVYNPFHSIGLFSVFDTDIMRNADIYTGGFGAEYGGRISSIMDITTKDGNKKRLSGKVGANTFGSKLLLEGPLSKETEPGGSSSSFIFSGKHSYLDQSSKLFYSYIDTAGLPFNYTDIYSKISFNGVNGSKFNLFGFSFNDGVKFQTTSELGWNNWGVGSNFILVPGSSPILVEGNFAYSKYDLSLKENGEETSFSSIDGFNFGLNFGYFQGNSEIKYGVEVLGFSTNFTLFNASGLKVEDEAFTTELAGFLNYKLKQGKLVFEPSFRLHYYASLTKASPEPRLGLKYNLTDNIRLKLATGMYSQNLISGNSDREVVNLFSGFLSGQGDLQDSIYFKNGNTKLRKHELQTANHFIVGAEWDVTRRFNINIEGYLKQFTQLTNINRNKIFESDDNTRPDLLKKDFIVETGEAFGVDFVLKYDYKRLYVWGVYSLGKVNRYDGITEYHPVFDRRHNINFLTSYTFGKNLDWEASIRWNLGSGFPFTQTQGFYEKQTLQDGVDTDYTTSNGQLGIYYADLNQGRLPTYHRLDASIKKKFVFSENSILDLNLGITNTYNRENIFYFDRVKFERVNQLPIMPSFGLNWSF